MTSGQSMSPDYEKDLFDRNREVIKEGQVDKQSLFFPYFARVKDIIGV
jgi:hypothetical protein